MRETELKLVHELIKNSRRSDRELAKSLGVSQPTVSRARTRLERQELVQYTGIPDLKELGFEIVAIAFGNLNMDFPSDVRIERGQDFLKQHSEMFFFSTGRGLGSDRVAVTAHKSFSEYHQFIQDLKNKWADIITITGSFLISTSSDNALRPLSFEYSFDH